MIDPRVLHTSSSSSFNVPVYLEGNAGPTGVKCPMDLVELYNSQENSNYGTASRKLVGDIKLSVDSSNFFGYNNLQEIKTIFNQRILPSVLTQLNVSSLDAAFPSANGLPVPHTARATAVRSWYDSVFGKFIDTLREDTLYSLMYSVDDKASKAQEFIVEFHDIYNFKMYGDNIPKLFNQASFELAALGRAYSDSEVSAMEESLYSTVIAPSSLSESISFKLFRAYLIALHKGYGGNTAYADAIFNDIAIVTDAIARFNKVIDVILSKTQNNFKVIP